MVRLFIKTLLILLVLIPSTGSCLAGIQGTHEPSWGNLRRNAVVKAVERARPAVVNISTEHVGEGVFNPFRGLDGESFFEEFFRDFFEGPFRRTPRVSLGSGVIIDRRGYILTNYHVIKGASKIRVTLADRREFLAKVVGSDPGSDLAVLKIDTEEELPEIPMGRSDDLMIGETVIAIGNPFGLSHTVTTGVISALNRSVRTQERIYHDFIQTDASINPGNSGGPLLNINGELIGINTAIYQKAQGVGFAIPIDRAKRIFQDLITYGEVHPAWIGLDVQEVDERLAAYFGLEGRKGVLVSRVVRDSPAWKVGLRKGDVILKIGTKEISSVEDYHRELEGYTADSVLELTFLRGALKSGRLHTVRVRASEFPAQVILKRSERRLGIRVSEVTVALMRRYSLSSRRGVVVIHVREGSLAYRIGIRPGDMIKQVDDQEIEDLRDYERAMARAIRRQSVLLLIQRGPYGYYVTLEMKG